MSDVEQKFLRRYSNFVLDKLKVPKKKRSLCIVSLVFVTMDDMTSAEERKQYKEAQAWVHDRGMKRGKRTFEIQMKSSRIKRRRKKIQFQFKHVMLDLAHELTHVKQYLNGELFDYASGDARYKGKYYAEPVRFEKEFSTNDDLYYDTPWEIEAFGREWGMWRRFHLQLKKEEKAKAKKSNGKEKEV